MDAGNTEKEKKDKKEKKEKKEKEEKDDEKKEKKDKKKEKDDKDHAATAGQRRPCTKCLFLLAACTLAPATFVIALTGRQEEGCWRAACGAAGDGGLLACVCVS